MNIVVKATKAVKNGGGIYIAEANSIPEVGMEFVIAEERLKPLQESVYGCLVEFVRNVDEQTSLGLGLPGELSKTKSRRKKK